MEAGGEGRGGGEDAMMFLCVNVVFGKGQSNCHDEKFRCSGGRKRWWWLARQGSRGYFIDGGIYPCKKYNQNFKQSSDVPYSFGTS